MTNEKTTVDSDKTKTTNKAPRFIFRKRKPKKVIKNDKG